MSKTESTAEAFRYRDTAPVERFAWAPLEAWVAAILGRADVACGDAELAAKFLVRSDARGFGTHGVSRLVSYVDKLKSGEIAPRGAPSFTEVAGALRVDGAGLLGQVVAPQAVDTGLELLEGRGSVVCQIRDVAHLGAVGMYALRAAEAGAVCLIMQATSPVMATQGATRPMIGNNPLALAAPRPNGPPIAIDMACCMAARGNILLAAREGDPIPQGWAIDPEGQPTTDADAALRGSLLPFGGHKGMALAMIVEILAASLAGATHSERLNPEGGVQSASGNLNAFCLLLSPDHMTPGGRAAYDNHITDWTRTYKAAGETAGERLPGERAAQAEALARREGVPLARSVVTELVALGREMEIAMP
ncbi:Ldh family oxidoreductase [Sedimentitalea sp. JM2-8]|uniref:Ldh family oxidoreductase n=1 Tax=Sedimentitalea xiamensis TaxID=3050037 RepID=A0ABT7FFL7_9RHOB|nr:Ldh family oxidoreductase [Sedimentitalea xiamensis]MDK3073907.1 Ldh family oxidoreductase [Sedimentitalea xiamensis]